MSARAEIDRLKAELSASDSGELLIVAHRAREEALSLPRNEAIPRLVSLIERSEMVRAAARKADLSTAAQNDWEGRS